jgi:hypothetical protein
LQPDATAELAADDVEDLLTRREAIRRLALGSLTATPAAFLAACSQGRTRRNRRRHK